MTTSVDQIGKKDTIDRAVRLPKTIDEVLVTLREALVPDICDIGEKHD